MKNYIKGAIALLLAVIICLGAVSCAGNKKSALDLKKYPLVFADKNGLEALGEGDTEPKLITKDFYTFLNTEQKVQAASNGKIYYLSTPDKKTILGDLYAYDVAKQESTLIHEGVYSFKVSADGEIIIISDGVGAIFKYDKKHEKKGDYPFIQKSGVAQVLDISADGKYVLYTQMLKTTNYYTLTIAKTDFETTDALDEQTLEQRRANKNVSKGPVFVAEQFKKLVGAADNLSVIYYEQSAAEQDEPDLLCAFKNFKENVVLSKREHVTYFVNTKGEIMFSQEVKGNKKISDIITDKYASKDAKLKKKSASKKQWKEKVNRDNTRDKINTYLENISTLSFYTYSKSAQKPEKLLEMNGHISLKGTDEAAERAFFGTTLYDFDAVKKPDIMKVSVVYKLFEEIKSRAFITVSPKGLEVLKTDEGSEYNSGDCYVDTANQRVVIIMDFDYSKSKVGTLYTVAYDAEGFGNSKKVSDKAAKVAHFDVKDDVYFVTANGALVRNEAKNVVLENYGYSVTGGKAPIAFDSIQTGKTDDYGNAITDDTAFLILGDKALKLGKLFKQKEVIVKGNMFACYTDYDYKTQSGNMVVYNGEKVLTFDSDVSVVYRFG